MEGVKMFFGLLWVAVGLVAFFGGARISSTVGQVVVRGLGVVLALWGAWSIVSSTAFWVILGLVVVGLLIYKFALPKKVS